VVDITTMNDTHVTNNQYVSSVDISSDLGARVTNVGGDVGIQGQAVCNSAGISTDPVITAISNTQVCDAVDPVSRAYVDAANINGSFSLANSRSATRSRRIRTPPTCQSRQPRLIVPKSTRRPPPTSSTSPARSASLGGDRQQRANPALLDRELNHARGETSLGASRMSGKKGRVANALPLFYFRRQAVPRLS